MYHSVYDFPDGRGIGNYQTGNRQSGNLQFGNVKLVTYNLVTRQIGNLQFGNLDFFLWSKNIKSAISVIQNYANILLLEACWRDKQLIAPPWV